MKVATITSQSEAQGIKVESAVNRLEIKFKSTHATALVAWADFLAQIDEVEIEVTKNTKMGSVTILPRTNLLDLFELAQANGGIIEGYQQGLANVIQSSVELSAFADQGLALQNQEFFEVNFFNFPVVADNTFNIDVFATDAENYGFTHLVYEKQYFNADSAREIPVEDTGLLAIPYAYADKVEITYRSGKRVKLSKEELIFRQRDQFVLRGTVTATDGKAMVNTFNRLILVKIEEAVRAEITLNTSANVICVKSKAM